MPIVYCPACGQEALVLITSSPQRTCSCCRQVFWTEAKRPPGQRAELPSQAPDRKGVRAQATG